MESSLTSGNSALAVLAPLWVDAISGNGDLGDGVVFYNTYTKWSQNHAVTDDVSDVINKATGVIRQQTGKSDYTASNVIVVTWSNMRRLGGAADEVSLAWLLYSRYL